MSENSEKSDQPRRKWPGFNRLKYPMLFIIASGTLWAAVEFNIVRQLFDLADAAGSYTRIEEVMLVLSKMSAIMAIGWFVTTSVDFTLKHRMSRLQLNEYDNLHARKRATKLDVLRRIWVIVGAVVTAGMAFMVIPWARQVGVSLFASAGIAGLALGLAARPVLSNLIAGLQIAFTQPVRIDDAVVIENEWGWIEEIGLFHVVIRIWDWRRLVIPLSYLIEKPFQNWTYKNASILGSTFWWVDYRAPVQKMREKLKEICAQTDLWDGDITNLQVVETSQGCMQIRALATASTSPKAWDLRCHIRKQMISWLQAEHPEALPRHRAEMTTVNEPDWLATRPTRMRPSRNSPEQTPNLDEN